MQDIVIKLDDITKKFYSSVSLLNLECESDVWDLQALVFDLEDLVNELKEISHGYQPHEVPAICLFCNSEFLRSQGHDCPSLVLRGEVEAAG